MVMTSRIWNSVEHSANARFNKQKVLTYLRTKRDEILLSGEDQTLLDSPHTPPRPPTDPYPGELLILHPSYCIKYADYYEVDVSGWLYQADSSSKRNKLLISMMRQTFGAPPPSATGDLSKYSLDQEERMKDRMALFFSRGAPFREIQVTIFENKQNPRASVHRLLTDNKGKLFQRLKVDFLPASIEAHATGSVTVSEVVQDVDSEGVSIISDIDDTIKHTGVTGDKRATFRNVFLQDSDKQGVAGAVDLYSQIQSQTNCRFHYVSNSPWQLFPSILQFLRTAGFPPGSIHLKHYAGLLSGLIEPSSTKKRLTLEQILRDFPLRKFVLIGDSGEADLEAYTQLSKLHPQQVVAIYIRDVLYTEDNCSEFQANYIPTPQEIDDYDSRSPHYNSSSTLLSKAINNTVRRAAPNCPVYGDGHSCRSARPGPSSPVSKTHSKPSSEPPPPPPPRGTPRGLGSTSTSTKIPPPPPRKPVHLRGPPLRPPKPETKPESPLIDSFTSNNVDPATLTETIAPVVAGLSPTRSEVSDENVIRKLEDWKLRFTRARQELPAHIRLRMWHSGLDLIDECILVVRQYEK